MKVIGAGLPRTGTTSLKLTLEALGYRPCYHMLNIWQQPSLVEGWSDAFFETPQWDRLLSGFEAAVDWPVAYYWRDLIQQYPDCKVILTVRDSLEWAASFEHSIWEVLFGNGLMANLSRARATVDPHWDQYRALMKRMWRTIGVVEDPELGFNAVHAAAGMERHNRAVETEVPRDRLLVWRPSEGVKPLADFLGVEPIDWEVPYANGEASFVEQVTKSSLAAIQESLEVTRGTNAIEQPEPAEESGDSCA